MATKKKSTFALGISLLSLVISGIPLTGPDVVQAQIYKWVDAEGRLHFSDSPIGKAEAVDAELPPASEFISPRPPTPPTPPQQTEPQGEAQDTAQDTEDATPPSPQTTDQAQGVEEEEEIGIGQYGPFGKDGPNGPIGLVDPQAGKK